MRIHQGAATYATIHESQRLMVNIGKRNLFVIGIEAYLH